jgi:AAA family ATP:ADP antiporter
MSDHRNANRATILFEDFVRVERNEYRAVAWSFACFFFILSSYYVLRPVKETMAVASGASTLPYLFLATFIVTLLLAPAFGWVASRFPRRSFLPWIFSLFVMSFLVFWFVLSRAIELEDDSIWLGRVLFILISVFSLFVVSIFWSFMADIFTREQSRRLFGVIAAGGSIGALLGGTVTSLVVVKIGLQNLLPISAALLFCAIFCVRALRQWVTEESDDGQSATADSTSTLGGSVFSGITHMFSSNYFLAIAFASIVASLLGTMLYMFTTQLVGEVISSPDERARFFSNINIATNALSLFGQFFLVKFIVQRFGIGISLSVLPVLSVVGFVLLAIEPTLAVIAIFTAVRRGISFAFSKPSSDMLYSVVTAEDKYKTKNFIDTAVFRGGDLIGSWMIGPILGFGVSLVSTIMLPFAAAWAAVALWLGRDYRRRAKQLRDSGIK